MIIILKPKITQLEKNKIIDKIHSLGLKTMVSNGVERSIIGVIGEEDILRVGDGFRDDCVAAKQVRGGWAKRNILYSNGGH